MLISSVVNGGWMEAIVVTSLVSVDLVFAVYTVFISGFLAGGLQPLFLVAAGGLIAAFLLLPLAIIFERKNWPKKIGLNLAIRLTLIAIGGTPLFQALLYLGIKKTTPAIATAMPNLVPGLIFIIASCLRVEKFDISCKYTKYKIMGTLMCLSGAMAISFLQGDSVKPGASTNLRSTLMGDGLGVNTSSNEWFTGCFYLLAGVGALSCVMVLQATTMVDFPAPMSMGAITALIGSFFAVMFQYILQGNVSTGATSFSITDVISAVLAGGTAAFLTSSVMPMCIHRKGPVFVSAFQPIQTICAAIISAIMLKQFISLGSLIGMGLMFAGLYTVLWAKSKEADEKKTRLISDEETPLLF